MKYLVFTTSAALLFSLPLQTASADVLGAINTASKVLGTAGAATKAFGNKLGGKTSDPNKDMCWKSTYGRGVGKPLSACPPDTDKDGALCYPKCKAGYKGVGPVCWESCPAGLRDDGAFCAKAAPYGRGAGYPWKVGDKAFSLNGARKRCERDHESCEKVGAIIYPKCKQGFSKQGCCICSPDCPQGMTDIGVSCAKRSYGRTAGKPMICAAGRHEDAGLCYKACGDGYKGVGPVCWGQCPADYPVNCGAACGVSSGACVKGIANMVGTSLQVVGNILAFVGTGGAAAAAKTGATAVAKAAAKAIIVSAAKKIGAKLATKIVEKVAEAAAGAENAGQLKLDDLKALDPTGIVNVVDAFNKPMCAKPSAAVTQ